MAKIVFRPTCGECSSILEGKTINGWFEGETYHVNGDGLIQSITQQFHIEPIRCPYCGSFFEAINMPNGKLPVNDNDLMHY